ncbi:Plasma membrane proteolipid 3-like protein 2 [Colletotrichum chrysophilum]|nr:Plasma membrane proteolipid 3-like protein 2 [Colletotrichum chrysophilum]
MLGAWVLPDLNGLAPATGLSLVRRKVRSEVRKRCTDGGKGAAPASPHHITVSSTGDRDLVHCAYLPYLLGPFFFFSSLSLGGLPSTTPLFKHLVPIPPFLSPLDILNQRTYTRPYIRSSRSRRELSDSHKQTLHHHNTSITMPFTASDICKILLAIILPPVGVFLERGCGADFFINILLTILGYLPGIIHALYIILKY